VYNWKKHQNDYQMIMKLLLGAVFISVVKFIHKCGFMKVTFHLTDAFY